MKTPELSVLHSETIGAALAVEQQVLAPSGGDLAALTDRLGLKTPDSLTAALVYPGDRRLSPNAEATDDPSKANVASVGMQDLSILGDGPLRITIGELSEQSILGGFAHSLIAREQFNQRMKVLKRGAGVVMLEVGAGSIAQGMGSNWGLLAVPLAGATIGGLRLWLRGWRNTQPVVPSLEGLESPIRIMGQQA